MSAHMLALARKRHASGFKIGSYTHLFPDSVVGRKSSIFIIRTQERMRQVGQRCKTMSHSTNHNEVGQSDGRIEVGARDTAEGPGGDHEANTERESYAQNTSVKKRSEYAMVA